MILSIESRLNSVTAKATHAAAAGKKLRKINIDTPCETRHIPCRKMAIILVLFCFVANWPFWPRF